MFHNLDYCMVCGAYDEIQTYVNYKALTIHICEKCRKKPAYDIAEQYVKKHCSGKYNIYFSECTIYKQCLAGQISNEYCANCTDALIILEKKL